MVFCFIHCNRRPLQCLLTGMLTVSFRIACDVLFDCGAHHITTMKGQVLVNRAISHFRKVIPAVVQREGRASGY